MCFFKEKNVASDRSALWSFTKVKVHKASSYCLWHIFVSLILIPEWWKFVLRGQKCLNLPKTVLHYWLIVKYSAISWHIWNCVCQWTHSLPNIKKMFLHQQQIRKKTKMAFKTTIPPSSYPFSRINLGSEKGLYVFLVI